MRHLQGLCKRSPQECRRRDVYEFGVFSGRALKAMAMFFATANMEVGEIWGFDSFQGIPQDAPPSLHATERGPRGRWADIISRGGFAQGEFNLAAKLGAHGVQGAVARVAEYVNVTRPPMAAGSRVHLIQGFYNESLTPTLVRERGMAPALYVDMDMDIYKSAFEVLDWLCVNKLMAKGTVLGYDDFNYGLTNFSRDGWLDGESRAHREIEDKWGLKVTVMHGAIIWGSGSGWAFVVHEGGGCIADSVREIS